MDRQNFVEDGDGEIYFLFGYGERRDKSQNVAGRAVDDKPFRKTGFGDGFASMAGKLFGVLRPSVLCGKSVEGSLACFIAVFVASYRVSSNIRLAIAASLTATAVEALPLADYDNLALPVTVGLVVQLASLPL